MNIFYLVTIILFVAGQNIVQKPYSVKTKGQGAYLFGLMTAFASMLFFVFSSKNMQWDIRIIPYSLLFATVYATSTIATFVAIASGAMSLTSLITSYSLMIPTVYGLIFLHESISIGFVCGIVLLMISLFLINQKTGSVKISLKWVISVTIAFVAGGLCSVFQNLQQVTFNGAYKNEFMIVALLFVSIVFFIMVLVKEKNGLISYVKTGWYMGLFCGIMNGIVNLFVMILSARMSVSIMFPLISAGGIIVTYIFSRFVFKERLTNRQFAGFILGIISVVLLNL